MSTERRDLGNVSFLDLRDSKLTGGTGMEKHECLENTSSSASLIFKLESLYRDVISILPPEDTYRTKARSAQIAWSLRRMEGEPLILDFSTPWELYTPLITKN